jgi:hypothetical protein
MLLEDDHVLFKPGSNILELRRTFCKSRKSGYIEDELQSLVISVLNLAYTGLEKRGYHEEHFLEPLYDRAKRNSNPANDYLKAINNRVPIKELILQYAALD